MVELLVFGENLKGINHLLCIAGNHWVVSAECIGNCVECLPTATYRTWTAHIGKGLPLIWYWVTRRQPEQGCPDFPLPRHFILLFREDSNVLPDHLSDPEDSSLPGSSPVSPPSGMCLKHFPRCIDAPTSWEHRVATLLWAPHPFSKTIPGHSAEETLLFHLHPAPCSFSHIAKFLALGEGRDVDWLVNRTLHLWDPILLYHDKPIQWTHYCGGCTYRPASLSLHPSLTRKQKPKLKVCLLHQWTALDRVLSWSIVP